MICAFNILYPKTSENSFDNSFTRPAKSFVQSKMTTPLFWNCCGLQNHFYKTFLRYSFLALLEPKSKLIVINRNRNSKLFVYTYIFVMIFVLLCGLDVFYQIWIKKSYSAPILVTIANILVILVMGLCLVLMRILIPNITVLFEQYINFLLKFERTILAKDQICKDCSSLMSAVQEGM